MNTVKRIGLYLAVPLPGLSIFAGVTLWSFQHYFGDGTYLKGWLEESQVYTAVRSEIVKQSINQNLDSNKAESVSLSKPVLQKALEKAISVAYLQTAVEEVIDGSYKWLSGEVSKPSYNIDVDPVKEAFASSILGSAEKRLSTLPDCVLADQATTTDPFRVNCKPPASISTQELSKLRKEITSNKDFLPKDITADTALLGEVKTNKSELQSQPWYQNVSNLPVIFQWLVRGPLIFLFVGLASIAIIVFCSTSRRNGIRRAGLTVLTSSLALALSSLVMLLIVRYGKTPGPNQDSSFYEPFLEFFRLSTNAVSRWQLISCLVLAAIGGAVLLGLKLTAKLATNLPAAEDSTPKKQ